MAGINHANNGPFTTLAQGQTAWESDHAINDAAAVRTALGLGTLATQSGTFSGTSSGTNTGDQTGGTPAVVLGTANTAGVSTNFLRRDDTILVFDGTVAAAIGTAATGSAGTAARRDHVHPTGAGTPSTQAYGDSAATGTGPAAAMTDHKHGMPAAITDATISTSDITTNDVSSTKHGFAPKGDGTTTKFLNANGAYSTPSGGSDLVQTISGGGSVYYPGLLGHPDRLPASPNAADDEFTALSGWTTLGTLDISNVSDFPNNWHGKRASSSNVNGIYKAVPGATPFTITAKFNMIDVSAAAHPSVGIMLLDSTPTAIRCFEYNYAGGTVTAFSLRRYTNRTTFATSIDTSILPADNNTWHQQLWMRLLVTSSSSVTFSYSTNGYVYNVVSGLSAISPTLTPAFMGICVGDPVSASSPECVVDYFRIT